MKVCRKSGRGTGVALAGWTVGLLAIQGCSKAPAPPPQQPAAVTVAQPLDREVTEWDEYPGRLEAKETVEIRARVNGYIQSVGFKEGGIVKKDDLLFVIDPRPYKAEFDRAQGEVSRAQAQLALAETQFKRTAGLVPTQAASELELDEKRAARDQAKAALSVAEANSKAAKLDIEFTEVRAPIDGRVGRIGSSEVFVTVGNLVTGGGSSPATLLTTITSLDPIYCYVDADERSVLKYQRLVREKRRPNAREGGQVTAKLALVDETVATRDGLIDFIDNRINPNTGTLRARGVFANPGGVMTPGLFGRMRVPGSDPYRALLVPVLAVQSDQNSKYVLTVDKENTVRITPVTVGSQFGTMRAITTGLKGDEHVIINGLLKARPGSKVQPQMVPMPGSESLGGELSTTRMIEAAPGAATRPTSGPSTQPVAAAAAVPVAARFGLAGEESR